MDGTVTLFYEYIHLIYLRQRTTSIITIVQWINHYHNPIHNQQTEMTELNKTSLVLKISQYTSSLSWGRRMCPESCWSSSITIGWVNQTGKIIKANNIRLSRMGWVGMCAIIPTSKIIHLLWKEYTTTIYCIITEEKLGAAQSVWPSAGWQKFSS